MLSRHAETSTVAMFLDVHGANKPLLVAYFELLKLVADKSVLLEEYAREMIVQEEMHMDEVNKMLRKPGDVQPFHG